jgi:hypothetical protein
MPKKKYAKSSVLFTEKIKHHEVGIYTLINWTNVMTHIVYHLELALWIICSRLGESVALWLVWWTCRNIVAVDKINFSIVFNNIFDPYMLIFAPHGDAWFLGMGSINWRRRLLGISTNMEPW